MSTSKFDQGEQAYYSYDGDLEDNPYDPVAEESSHLEWNRGFICASSEPITKEKK